MESLVQIGLSNAVVALVLAAIAALVGALVRKPALTHGLWLLVLIKLVTPPLFLIPIGWSEPASEPEVEAQLARAIAEAEAAAQMPPVPFEVWVEGEIIEIPGDVAAKPGPALAVDPRLPGPAEAVVASNWWLLGGLWLLGTGGWFALALYRVWCFQRLLTYAQPAPAWLCEQVAALAEQLGLKRVPAIWLIPGRLAPMIWMTPLGPRLLLPVALWENLPAEQRRTLLVHELAHLVRRDHWVRVLEMATLGLYWWHPIVWIACRQLREAEEQCCDAWVVSTIDGSGRDYAQAILETLDFLAKARTVPPLLASGVGQVSDLKRRLTMILRGTTPRALSWRGLLGLLTLAIFLLPALPVLAQPPGDKVPDAIRELREKLAELEKKLGRPAAAAEAPKVDKEALKKAEAELKEAQAALEKKTAELRELHQKVAAAQEKVRKAGGRVEATPGMGRGMFFLHMGDGATGGFRMAPGAGFPGMPRGWGEMVRPGQPGGQPHFPGQGPDRRIEHLERQLERVLQELQDLRRVMPAPGRGPGPKNPMRSGTGGPDSKPEQPRRPDQPRPETPRGM